jgi:hypothetical protein
MQPPSTHPATTPATPASRPAPGADVPFGVNEVRLNARQWLAVGLILVLAAALLPWLWQKLERFETGPDYRIPYSLSKDYWLFERRLGQVEDPRSVLMLGDSVVWGEYVLPDGTWTHFLNQEAGTPARFVNAGVNGLFPLALEGLIQDHAHPCRNRKVLVHCNMLWMTSPKADLSTEKEEQFNHASLVPQFSPRLPCYKADASTRLSVLVQRNIEFLGWIDHLQNAYFDQKSILSWTLADDGNDPPHYPNAWKNPLRQLTLTVPAAPAQDPDRGPNSPRHKPWSLDGSATTRFDWVELNRSLQWQAFQRLTTLLKQRGNDVCVVLGPFNEHMIAEDNRPAYRRLRDGMAAWLAEQKIQHVLPQTLPSRLYADASHPLTEGYQQLAHELYAHPNFQRWLKP